MTTITESIIEDNWALATVAGYSDDLEEALKDGKDIYMITSGDCDVPFLKDTAAAVLTGLVALDGWQAVLTKGFTGADDFIQFVTKQEQWLDAFDFFTQGDFDLRRISLRDAKNCDDIENYKGVAVHG